MKTKLWLIRLLALLFVIYIIILGSGILGINYKIIKIIIGIIFISCYVWLSSSIDFEKNKTK